nr:hypothetical protein [Rhodococcus rhodochrous]
MRTLVLPAPIAPQPSRIPWRLHADPHGCWIVGWYGVFRAADTAEVQRLDDRPVSASAAHNGTLLTCTTAKTATRIDLWHPDGQCHHNDTTVPAGTVTAVTADDDGFRILLRLRDTWPVTSVVAVHRGGHITVGPPLHNIDSDAVLTPDPAAVLDLRGTIRTLLPDLHTEPPTHWPLPGLTGSTVGDHIWIEHHDLHDDRDPVHMAFDRPGVVFESQAGGDGIEVTAQTRGEGPQGR